jgi:hypothetical protein
MTKEDLEIVINRLIERHGDQLPNPDHYPKIAKTMVIHELYTMSQEKPNEIPSN